MGRVDKANPGALTSSYFSTHSLAYVSRDRHTTFQRCTCPAVPASTGRAARSGCAPSRRAGLPAGTTVNVTGSRRARRGEQPRLERGLERPPGDADRWPRRADHPPLRLRDAAGGPDAAGRRRRGDPQHVHARLVADVRHERVGDRAVPDRPGGPRHRDRLLVADDLPLPRRATGRKGRRVGARRDDDPRRTLGDRLRNDRGGRSAGDDRPAAAAASRHGHRRDADPRRLGARVAHLAAGAAGRTRHADQQRARDAKAVHRPRPSGRRRLGTLGALRAPPPGCGRRNRSGDRRRASRVSARA